MRSGRSRPPHFLIRSGGLRPRGPPHAFARGSPMPRSASAGSPVARLELVKRVLVLGGSRAPHQIRGASPPRTPPRLRSRGPNAPLRFGGRARGAPRTCETSSSAGRITGSTSDPGGFAPADPPTPSLAGPQRPAPPRRARPRGAPEL